MHKFSSQNNNYDAIRTKEKSSSIDPFNGEGDLLNTLLPIWAEQIVAARNTTNVAIESLSQRFSNLSKQIESKSDVSNSGNNSEELIELIKDSQSQLGTVISILHSTFEDKKILINAILELSQQSKALAGLANEVSHIARETNLVAINAAIEAAHIGQEGRGFAVVASAVRRLSADAGRAGSNITDVVKKVSNAINKVDLISHEFEEKEKPLLIKAEKVVESVVTKFDNAAQEITNSSQQMLTQGQHIKNEINDVLVSLQFQDRVSQMLGHVHDDIYKLHGRMESNSQIDKQEWLTELEATYTTKEQHLIHQGKPYLINPSHILNDTKANDGDSDEVTFF